jgi:CheY-like chemotaxis protein
LPSEAHGMTRTGSDLSAPGDPPLRERALFSLLIADADAAFRRLVREHLGRVVAVVADVGDGDEAVRLARRLRPDVVLMDMAMPLIGGPEAARRIKADRAETKVVLLTSGDEKTHPGSAGTAGDPAPVLHADALLPKKNMRAGILSHLGRLERRRVRR